MPGSVEKHMPGRDYRVTVLQGEVIWAIERVPGGIEGDGQTSVRGLIEQLNNDPRRSAASHAVFSVSAVYNRACNDRFARCLCGWRQWRNTSELAPQGFGRCPRSGIGYVTDRCSVNYAAGTR